MEQSTRFRNFLRTLLASASVLLFLTPNLARGQGYHLGLQLKPNFSMSEPRELSHEGIGTETHFGYGFVFDAMFTENYAIGTGVNVFYNGAVTQHLALNEDQNGAYVEAVQLRQQQQYVEVPVTFKMRTNEIGYATYFGQFGVGLGLNVRSEGSQKTTPFAMLDSLGGVSELVFNASSFETVTSEQVSMASRTRLFRPSLIIGLGVERRLTGSTALVFAVRYNLGLRNQYEEFSVLQAQAAEELVYQYDAALEQELPIPIQMQGKTGQIELCFGLMF